MRRAVSTASIDVVGVKETLRTLNKIDKVARRQLTKDYAQIVSVVISDARAATPSSPPLSGMGYRWDARRVSQIFPWNNAKSDRAIKPFVSGKRPRKYGAYTSDLATFGIKWTAADALTVEMAGRGSAPTAKGKQMVAALNARYGTPGRFLWKAYEKHEQTVVREVEQLIRQAERRIQEEL